MDHDKVEVRHGRAHEHGNMVGLAKLGRKLSDQRRYVLWRRPLINDLATLVVTDVDRRSTVLAGALRQVVSEHHEMEASQKRLVEREVFIVGQLLDVGQRVAVS